MLRDRIKEVREVRVGDLLPAEFNWRAHPEDQRQALAGSLAELGIVDVLRVREMPDGSLQLWDGHLRREEFMRLDPDLIIKVAVTDLDEAEAKKANLVFDPIAAMAEADKGKLDALLREIDTGDEGLQKMLAELAEQEGVIPPEQKPKGNDEEDLIENTYGVLIKCKDEREQKSVLTELSRHPLDVRAMVVEGLKAEPQELPAPVELPPGEIEIKRSVGITRTPRTMQLEGMFDVPPTRQSEQTWRFRMELDRPWSVGLIVGASGSGKSTVARELFGEHLVATWPWSDDKAVVDDFPADMGIGQITGLLSSVGFSSPPAWLKPFRVLSNGEQFRVNLARTLAEQPDLAVIDEFTSVVDRTVAQIGSAALAKAVRASNRRIIAVSCHYDIEEWLQPDWKLEMPAGELTWRLLRRRPAIQLSVRRVGREQWATFRRHHYLSHSLSSGCTCFVAEVNGRPAAFTAVVHSPGRYAHAFREHRTVCHPDFQGVGVGNAMSELIASAYAAKYTAYRSVTSHPAMIRHRLRSPKWRCCRPPSLGTAKVSRKFTMKSTQGSRAAYRYTASFEYIGDPNFEAASVLGVA